MCGSQIGPLPPSPPRQLPLLAPVATSMLPSFPIQLYPVHDRRNPLPPDSAPSLRNTPLVTSGSTNTPGIKGLSRNVRDPPSPSGRFLFTKHCTIPALANLLHTLMAARRPTPHFPYRFPTSVVLHRPLLRISSLHFPSNSATVNNLFFAQMLASRSGSSLGQYPSLMKTWRHVDFLLTFLCIQSHANRYAIRLRIELLA